MRRRLQQRHWLRLHAVLTGLLAMLVMLSFSVALRYVGVPSMGLRYGLSLGAGYLLYLLLVRLWAECMIRRDWGSDVPSDASTGSGHSGAGSKSMDPMQSGEGGSFGGGGSSGQWDGPSLGDSAAEGLSDLPSRALESVADAGSGVDWSAGLDGLGGLDEGAVVLVPVLAAFAMLVLAFTGLGSLLWLIWGSELFLAIAVETAFAMLMARSLYVMEREGWLLVALRLSWKPMLGALLCVVLVGFACDYLFPEADTLNQVLAAWRSR